MRARMARFLLTLSRCTLLKGSSQGIGSALSGPRAGSGVVRNRPPAAKPSAMPASAGWLPHSGWKNPSEQRWGYWLGLLAVLPAQHDPLIPFGCDPWGFRRVSDSRRLESQKIGHSVPCEKCPTVPSLRASIGTLLFGISFQPHFSVDSSFLKGLGFRKFYRKTSDLGCSGAIFCTQLVDFWFLSYVPLLPFAFVFFLCWF